MTDFTQRDLKGKNVLITGASKGIGKHLAEKLNELGAHLYLLARNKNGDLDEVVETLKKTNEHVYGFTCDVSSLSEIKQTFQQVGNVASHLDVLVCNSSIMPGFKMGIDQLSDELDLDTYRTNVEGYHFCTKYALPLLSKSTDFDRTIVYVTSEAGWLTKPPLPFGMVAYCVSKAAENALTVSMHNNYVSDVEFASEIRKPEQKLHRVVSVHPGFVQTTLGSETWNIPPKEMLETKSSIGAIPIDAGVDTLYWLITAKDGVESGKTYYKRQVVPF